MVQKCKETDPVEKKSKECRERRERWERRWKERDFRMANT